MSTNLPRLLSSWVFVVFISYFVFAGFQKLAIYPLEARLFPLYSQYASLLYLPHAVRVLATAIYGPKAFFVLFPTILITQYDFHPVIGEFFSITSVSSAIIGASCAPLAYVILKRVSPLLFVGFDSAKAILNWRYVFVAGVLASAINSVGLAILFFDISDIGFHELAHAMVRFFVGDAFGLIVGLVLLTRVFRIIRNVGESSI